MILHYNIYPAKNNMVCGHIVWFHFSECSPSDVIAIAPYIQSCMDKSVGEVIYSDWDWLSEQGTIRMRSGIGCPEETLVAVCDKVIREIREILNVEPCGYCPRKK